MAVLDVPYRSQLAADAGVFRNDCGAACVAMWLSAQGKVVSVDEVFRATSASSDRPTSTWELIRAASKWELTLLRAFSDVENLKARLMLGKGYIALIHYGTLSSRGLTESRFTGAHFVNVVGFQSKDAKPYILLHDPLWHGDGGRYLYIPEPVFYQSWLEATKDGNPSFIGLTVEATFPKLAASPDLQPLPEQPLPVWGIGTLTGHMVLRAAPTTSSTILGYLLRGTNVSILEPPAGGWYHVMRADGRIGYCGGRYLSVVQTPPPPEPPPMRNFAELTRAEKDDLLKNLAITGGLLTEDGGLIE